MSATATRGCAPRDATHALRLPAVPAERLDAVLRAAGPRLLPALAVLCSAIGWYLARSCRITDRPLLLRGLVGAIDQAAQLHGDGAGQG